MNWLLELHDSEIIAIHNVGHQLFVFIDGYMHGSEGKPGYDAGIGCTQALALVFDNGAVTGDVEIWPAYIMNGKILIGEEFAMDNGLPLPFDVAGAVKLELVLAERGEKLVLTGTRLSAVRLGDPHYSETFTP